MMRRYRAFALLMLVVLGCSRAAHLVRVDDVPPGTACAAGGLTIQTGVDDDDDGNLGDNEIDDSRTICNGDDGDTSLVRIDQEAAGGNCPFGGLAIHTGVDDNRDGVLGPAEIDTTNYACEARAMLTVADPEAPGTHCAAGGVRLRSGPDVDGDGALDDAEVTQTSYVCNGMAGDLIAVRSLPEPAGAACLVGGTALQSGVDDDRDGLLDDSEVDSTSYVCNGATGDAALVETATEPAGARCPAGGTLIRAGLDVDGSGTLSPAEVSTTSYVCNGHDSVVATYRQKVAETLPVAQRTLGVGVSADASTLVMTSRFDGSSSTPVVFVYDRTGASAPWTQRTTIIPPAQNRSDGVAKVRNGVIAVGAYADSTEGPARGAVRIYERTGIDWPLTQQLFPEDSAVENFGMDVAVGDGLIAIASGGIPDKVFVFGRSATTGAWSKLQAFTLPSPTTARINSVAISGETIVVGGRTVSTTVTTGAVWVYDRVPATGLWTFSQEVRPLGCCPELVLTASYGNGIAIEGNRLAVSYPGDDAGGTDAGRVFVFDRVFGQGWVQRGAFYPADAAPGSGFGGKPVLRGDTIFTTMTDDEFGTGDRSIRIFQLRTGSGWTEVQKLVSPEPDARAGFGRLTLAGTSLVVCTPYLTIETTMDAGACHDYALQP